MEQPTSKVTAKDQTRYEEIRDIINAHLDNGTLTRDVWLDYLREAAGFMPLDRLAALVELGALEGFVADPREMWELVYSLKEPATPAAS